jgi:hypothetical protein
MKPLFPSPVGDFVRIIYPGGEFGNSRPGHSHGGVDLACGRIPLIAQADGVITVAGLSTGLGGNKVEQVADPQIDGFRHYFKHYHFGHKAQPWQDCIFVRPGQRVRRGQELGIAGDSGNAVAVHDHYEHWVGGQPFDPLQYLREYQVIRRPLSGLRLALTYPGSRGPDIPHLQRQLSVHGFPCQADGIYGPATLAAVKAFQAARGLEVDGIVGYDTWRALLRRPAL